MNLKKEIYTLEQLRKMSCLDGDKELVFYEQVRKYLKYYKDEFKKIIEEHQDCRHEYCNLSKETLPCWKVIKKDLEKVI